MVQTTQRCLIKDSWILSDSSLGQIQPPLWNNEKLDYHRPEKKQLRVQKAQDTQKVYYNLKTWERKLQDGDFVLVKPIQNYADCWPFDVQVLMWSFHRRKTLHVNHLKMWPNSFTFSSIVNWTKMWKSPPLSSGYLPQVMIGESLSVVRTS